MGERTETIVAAADLALTRAPADAIAVKGRGATITGKLE